MSKIKEMEEKQTDGIGGEIKFALNKLRYEMIYDKDVIKKRKLSSLIGKVDTQLPKYITYKVQHKLYSEGKMDCDGFFTKKTKEGWE
ncbi:hypothetical protein [Virgibacillus sp. DJP39]|uniref:hypothetical protein n=1 Tax=Virgibacillus sp. DJP39 TaxID=3409790 RepID=UPI003BB4ECB4